MKRRKHFGHHAVKVDLGRKWSWSRGVSGPDLRSIFWPKLFKGLAQGSWCPPQHSGLLWGSSVLLNGLMASGTGRVLKAYCGLFGRTSLTLCITQEPSASPKAPQLSLQPRHGQKLVRSLFLWSASHHDGQSEIQADWGRRRGPSRYRISASSHRFFYCVLLPAPASTKQLSGFCRTSVDSPTLTSRRSNPTLRNPGGVSGILPRP